MSKKNFIIILVLSVVVTYGLAILQFATSSMGSGGGLPFSFSSFNFLGSETNMGMLILDVIFWFIVLFGMKKLIKK